MGTGRLLASRRLLVKIALLWNVRLVRLRRSLTGLVSVRHWRVLSRWQLTDKLLLLTGRRMSRLLGHCLSRMRLLLLVRLSLCVLLLLLRWMHSGLIRKLALMSAVVLLLRCLLARVHLVLHLLRVALHLTRVNLVLRLTRVALVLHLRLTVLLAVAHLPRMHAVLLRHHRLLLVCEHLLLQVKLALVLELSQLFWRVLLHLVDTLPACFSGEMVG